jgi:hypothetical protein
MQSPTPTWAALEEKLVQLAGGHDRLVGLIERQRQAIRKANPELLAEVGLRIDAEVRELARIESARRDLCQQLAAAHGIDLAAPGAMRIETFCRRAGDRWGRRLRLAAAQLAGQVERVARAGRINIHAAGQLSSFCGELMGEVARVARDTGCYDSRGRRALARQPVAASCFSAVG